MTQTVLKPLTLALMTLGLTTGAAWAGDDKAPNLSDTKAAAPSASVQAVDNLLLARQVAAYAQSHQDALGLVVAARMLQDLPTQEATWKKEGGTDQAAADPLTVDVLLGQAREQSGGRPEVLALVEETAKRGGTKDSISGPIRHLDRVGGNSTDIFAGLKFRGNEEAIIGVVGQGNADLDCWVYDQGGHLIRSDTDGTATCALRWVPSWTGTFTLKVRNYSSSASNYLIVSN